MNLLMFFIIYLFSIIGYLVVGLFTYINLDDISFNKLGLKFNELLKKIFYSNNKENCKWKDGHLFYNHLEYFDSKLWNENYEPFNTIFELLSIVFWPLWIVINLIINAFNDD